MPSENAPLAEAFLRQSVAAAKNHIRAQKAAQEGTSARTLFLGLAMGQEAQAKKALFLLRGRVGATDVNLAEALQETRELAVDALAWTDRAQVGGDRAAGALLMQMARVQASHLAAYEREAKGETVFHVCPICGYIHAGGTPGRCPVCNALPEKFVEVCI